MRRALGALALAVCLLSYVLWRVERAEAAIGGTSGGGTAILVATTQATATVPSASATVALQVNVLGSFYVGAPVNVFASASPLSPLMTGFVSAASASGPTLTITGATGTQGNSLPSGTLVALAGLPGAAGATGSTGATGATGAAGVAKVACSYTTDGAHHATMNAGGVGCASVAIVAYSGGSAAHCLQVTFTTPFANTNYSVVASYYTSGQTDYQNGYSVPTYTGVLTTSVCLLFNNGSGVDPYTTAVGGALFAN